MKNNRFPIFVAMFWASASFAPWAQAITTPQKSDVVPPARAGMEFRNNIIGISAAIDSGRFHGKRLANLYQFRGVLRGDSMELELALEDFTTAIRLDPKNAENHLQYAIVLYKLMREEEAVVELARAEKLNDHMPLIYMQRAHIHYYNHRYDAALRDFIHAWQLYPKDHYAVLWIYIAAQRAGVDGIAEMHARVGELDMQEWPNAIVQLYLGTQSDTQFLQSLLKGGRSAWQVCEGHFFLGQYYALHGDNAAAAAQFRKTQAMHLVEFIEHYLAMRELQGLAGL